MKRLVGILAAGVALIVLASCSLPWEKSPNATRPAPSAQPSPSIPACAQLLAQAMLVTSGVVAGAYACIDPAYAAQGAAVGGPTSDAELAKDAAMDPTYTSMEYVGETTLGYYYQYSGPDGPGCFRFHVDSTGHVDHAAYGPVACPLPLP